MKSDFRLQSFALTAALTAALALVGCSDAGSSGGPAGAGPGSGASGAGATGGSYAGVGAGNPGGGTSGSYGGGGVAGSGGGVVGSGGGGPNDVRYGLAPSTRNPKYQSMAPPLGTSLPSGAAGTWIWTDIEGAVSRDGSPAGFYYKYSATGDKRLLIYLVGGGACQDNFFCANNPKNKTESLTAESYIGGATNLMGSTPVAQDPTLAMWQTGIFKNDPANPVKDWNMIFIPYVSGDLWAGNKRDATVPGFNPLDGKPLQFQGRPNILKFMARIIPTFIDAPIVMLTGSSAGGIGALLNMPIVADGFIDNTTVPGGMRMFGVDDAGPVFDDQFTPICLQQRYRDLYALNTTFPPDCAGCRNADGGGMVKGYLEYLIDKYPDNLLGGLIDSDNDEIMQLFFVTGYNNCDPTIYPPVSFPASQTDPAWSARFKNGMLDLIQNKMQRMSSYVWTGTYHQNLFQPGITPDRFYDKNGLDMSVAEWMTQLLSGQELHKGLQ